MAKRILTYGTFDTLHFGHVRLLTRARALGDELFVGLSTDPFNAAKGKQAALTYDERKELLLSLRVVDFVFPERDWEQKPGDIEKYNIDTFVMGDDWAGKFDSLKSHCSVHYFSRTDGISSTGVRRLLQL